MSVNIGHASSDENKAIKGGNAGDQTAKEVCVRTWYNKPWTTVFRPKNSSVAEKIAKAMEQACVNDKIGYDQSQRTTLYEQAKLVNWDLSKITTACECDCSALVAVCVNAAGISVSKSMYTGIQKDTLDKTGEFSLYTSSKYTGSADNLMRGDILLGDGHTAVVLSNGATIQNECKEELNNMAFKIALSAGHGKNTAGKRCMKSLDPNETREWVLNDRIADKVEKLLKSYSGYELLRVDDTTGATDVALKKRTNAANSFNADFYLAIHHNAGVNGGSGGGIVVFVYTSPSAKSLEWQKALYNELIEKTGLRGNRTSPMPKGNLHECREPKMPAVLLELGFMDSSTDVPVILTEKYADQCANAIVNVLVEKGNLTKKATTSNSTTSITTYPMLKQGATGTYVKMLQNRLNELNCSCGNADGDFGKKTFNAVVKFQRSRGLDDDGIVGQKTWDALHMNFAVYSAKITANTLNIRDGAGKDNDVIGTIDKNSTVKIVDEINGWGFVPALDGWISLSYTAKI